MVGPMWEVAIWKFTLALTDSQTLTMPHNAKVLTVQMQHGNITLWAKVCPAEPSAVRQFAIVGTGHISNIAIINEKQYVGTVQDDSLVWHIFDLGEHCEDL